MGLPKGRTNNRNGRPVGSINKEKIHLRDLIKNYLDANFTRIEALIETLDPKDQVKAYIDLMQYSLPKLASVQTEIVTNLEITWQETKTYSPDKRPTIIPN